MKGIAHPLKTYEVVATREDFLSGARTISEIRDGFRLSLDPMALAPDDREQTKEVLREALGILDDLNASKSPGPTTKAG